MMICKYFVWFIVYSFFGWIYESTYCTIRKHKWENRGFLYGPIVPIYGVGALLASIVFSVLPVHQLQQASNLQIFIVCFLGSIVLEYSTSWILEKLFHAYWWDYSNVICNINGRVCLPASIGFGVAGILVVNVFLPMVSNMTSHVHPLLMEGLALAFMLMFGMDLALTVSALTNFAKNFARIEAEINDRMTLAYDNLESTLAEKKDTLMEKTSALSEKASAITEKASSIAEKASVLTERKEAYLEKKEQRQEASFVRKELRSEKAAELRERLTSEYLENLMKSTSTAQKGALMHIQGFKRDKKSSDNNSIRERMVTMMKERRELKKKSSK